MNLHAITSPHNQRVKDAVKLRDHRQRSRQGRFIMDGARELLRALEGGVRVVELFVCEAQCTSGESLQALGAASSAGVHLWHVTPEILEKLTYGERSEGLVAVAETPHPTLEQLHVPADSVVAVVEGLEKPGNVGAVIRSADAAGVAAVIAADGRTDLYNPNCVRASLGTVFTRPVCAATSRETLAWLRGRGTRIFAARVDAEQLHTDVDLRGDVAVVLGSEAEGLSAAWHAADITGIRLPMQGAADSLNVSATAAVLFYEALRQRGPAS